MIKWNKQFEYPASIREVINNKRHYAIDDTKLPSVTTILQATQSDEKKKILEDWKTGLELTMQKTLKMKLQIGVQLCIGS